MEEQTLFYKIVLSQISFEQIIAYKSDLVTRKIKPGVHLRKSLDTLSEQGISLDQNMSNETFIDLLLSTKFPQFFAEISLKADGTDWNSSEIKLLGDINVTMPVEIYDNGVWATYDKHFQIHDPPVRGELMFIPGPLLEGSASAMKGRNPPDLEEILKKGGVSRIDQDKYNELIARRVTPLLYHANETAKKDSMFALITMPGIGCGAFAGKYLGQMGEYLNRALQHILVTNATKLTHISCVYYDPFNECINEDKDFKSVKYRVRPNKYNPDKSQLMAPKDYEEPGDDFSKCKLFKIVAWDHVSYPGNDYFLGSRKTDDGVSAAATNSMENLTGVQGRYEKGHYLPPNGKVDCKVLSNWKQVVQEKKIKLRAKDNVKIVTHDGSYLDLSEFEGTCLQTNK